MHGAVEGEVELDVPLQPVELRALRRRCAARSPASRTPRWRWCSSDPAASPSSGRRPRTAASARAKSPRSTTSGCVGLAGDRVPAVPVAVVGAERVVADRARADVDRSRRRRDRARCSSRTISMAACSNALVGRRPAAAAGPGRRAARRPTRAGRTPRRGPSGARRSAGRCRGSAAPFCATNCASASGCQRFGSTIVGACSATTSGGFTGR